MRMILIIFQKRICLGQVDHFGPKNGESATLDLPLEFFSFLQNEKCQ